MNIPKGFTEGIDNLSIKISTGILNWFISFGFGFVLTYTFFSKSPFLLFMNAENFFYFYISVFVIGVVLKFSISFIMGKIKYFINS